MSFDELNQKDRKYEDDRSYIRIGNEWYSLDDLVLKKDVLNLVYVVEQILIVMLVHDGIGEKGFESLRNILVDLKDNLK
jgi:hypothetical protein